MLLGIDWLNFHNPEVDWSTPSLQFTRCAKRCSKNASQLTIRWTAKAEKPPAAPPKPEVDENGLSKGLKPDYIKPFQHLFEKKNFDKQPIRCEWDHKINLTEDAPVSIPARLYRMTPVEQEAVDQFVEDELKAGKIVNPNRLMLVLASLSQKRMEVVALSKIIEKSMHLQSRTKPRYPASTIFWMC